MKGKSISYRPSESVQKLIDKYCGENSLLSNTQLIEIAFQHLLIKTEDEIDGVVWKFMTGKGAGSVKTQKKIS